MKKLIKNILLWIGSIVCRDTAAKVVFYHDIGTKYTKMGTPPDVFKKHLEVVGRRLKVEGIEDLICFDDGFRGIFEHREMLKEVVSGKWVVGRVKVFIAVDLVGKPGYLTWDEIRTLNREYGVDFQSHTWSHQTLVGPWNEDDVPREERTEEWYKREVEGSRLRLEEELGKEEGRRLEEEGGREKCVVDELCFPVGYFSDELIERCKKAGYRKVYASFPGSLVDSGKWVVGSGQCVVVPRCLVQDLSPWAFKAVLNGGMGLFKKRYLKRHKISGE